MLTNNSIEIRNNICRLRQRINNACKRSGRNESDLTLVAITKGVGIEEIKIAYAEGIRHFGENRVQEAWEKYHLIADIKENTTWHMVGHLQSNKVNKALQLFNIFESVDSIGLSEALNTRSARRMQVLLQVNISAEPNKSGFAPETLENSFNIINTMSNIEVRGLMTIAPICANPENVRPYFRRLRELSEKIGVKDLSMGMTDDFEVAIEEGATIIRIGRAIFSERGNK